MSVLIKTIYIFNAMTNKIPMSFFTVTGKSILHLLWKNKRPLATKTNLEQKEQCWGCHNT
jgi:hypothetical protein